jgi:hypothetical protein
MSIDEDLAHESDFSDIWTKRDCLLVGFEEETVFAIVYHGDILVFGHLLGCELDMSKDPCLQGLIISNLTHLNRNEFVEG